MVLIEAMQSGVPIVSTDCRHGPAEVLDHGRFDTIVPVGDWKALRTALEAELAAPRDFEANRTTRAAWLAQLEPEVIAAQYVELVREVIEGANPSGASLPHRQLHNAAVS
jgi:glycosyltransferase involved in cell wall biosynthesis